TEHPAFRNVIRSIAYLYDLQYEKQEKMLYTSPSSGNQVGKTFMQPTTIDEIIARREAMTEWATTSGGMLGRSPGYVSRDWTATEMNYHVFGAVDPRVAEDARDFYEYARENDISCTHTLIHPQVNRAKMQHDQKNANVALHLVEER